MDGLRTLGSHPVLHRGGDSASEQGEREAWEDWEDDVYDDQMETPTELIDIGSALPFKPGMKTTTKHTDPRLSAARQSGAKIRRLKSRQRQKAQNAKAGIKLETDMSKFRDRQHIAQQMRPAPERRDSREGKFVDIAALKALEGEPSSASVGSFAWMKKKAVDSSQNKKPKKAVKAEKVERTARRSSTADLSPNERPIVIGLAVSPQTITAINLHGPESRALGSKSVEPALPAQHSVWSPDTEDGLSPFRSPKRVSSFFSTAAKKYRAKAVPSNSRRRTTVIINDEDDDDAGTPVTLFQEDGSPVSSRKSPQTKGRPRAPTDGSAHSRGWWDQVTTPFDTVTPGSARSREDGDWWKGVNEKQSPVTGTASFAALQVQLVPSLASSSRSPSPSPNRAERQSETINEKMSMQAESSNRIGADAPPPYTPPEKKQAIRYRAVFPPGHPLGSAFPPSPGPVSPDFVKTMGNKEDIRLGEIPASAADDSAAGESEFQDVPLPDRPVGTFVPDVHGVPITGYGPWQDAERKRRRHEKEDIQARRIGGVWRGRCCCVPLQGFFARPGREGRRRRRIALAICGVLLAMAILAVVLAVTLTHKAVTVAAGTPYSQWFNLTGFPPIYTGISTVIGTENTQNNTVYAMPSTMWSCSLPKEQQADVLPYQANQPSFIFQIQYDNSSLRLWDTTGQAPTPTASATPTPTPSQASVLGQGILANGSSPANLSASSQLGSPGDGSSANLTEGTLRARGGAVGVLDFLRSVLRLRRDNGYAASPYDPGFSPDPAPPSFEEYWFLGNTTDGVVADEKAGEATPFYVSVLPALNQSVGPDVLTRRDEIGGGNATATSPPVNLTAVLPPPALNADGTGAPAQMLPFPYQQPLRLFDRGLPTEHYGFYSYFNRTIYVQSIANQSTAEDRDGGAPETAAAWLVTWSFTRYKVAMWTRMSNATATLLSPSTGPTAVSASASATASASASASASPNNTTQPGTFPYPVTVSLDLHGGPVAARQAYGFAYAYGVNADQTIDLDRATIVAELVDAGYIDPDPTALVNPYTDADLDYGGIDGGTGGCTCVWQNFVSV